MARVTAIVPLKNYEESFLRQCFASLLAQSSGKWKCLVVVEPADVVHFARLLEAELADPRVALVANEGRKLSGAINTGIRRAETDFVALLLADDLWAPEAIEVLTRNIESRPDVDFFHSARRVIYANGEPRSSVLPPRASFRVEEFVEGSPVKHLLCFRRAKALAVGGLDETLNSVGPDDYDFPWTMAERGARFAAISECLYIYRDHRDGYRLTTHLPLSVHTREIARVMRKHGVGRMRIAIQLFRFRRGYLRQCLYRNPLDRWIKERLGYDAANGWRQPYR
jgi:glycosyltransferase involved in cell wall biosynthesis